MGLALHGVPGIEPVVRAPVLGWGIAVVGLVIAVAAKARFRRDGTALAPIATPTRLYTDGPYRLSRNPMYVGIAGVLLGAGLILGSVPALLGAPIYLSLMRRYFVGAEELGMAAAFGNDWRCYAAQVPRWL